ncbi:hypothetical protein G6F46_006749 [Rhizopus delemar]|uniref:C2H2-type domain-containing protein n=3 Tax=Rhizopus TaxID=4842 RepID=I1BVC1_RHIO9|nr:hypothetical protein RO3G_04856 [Rhizopus delemar RA 99-880]KAG1448380.1 hypothetical protein G6F55_010673 [Rhizopus delemar]KAG1535827.1 hypothetical protein G6F51_011319 [Rhizopus arrhizus]KAG1497035.1 hypothetical protein G6F54_006048 [Rhizopus delemar]KAG1499055.1 hypothetical protein G6F52_012700 [Rhizopus delemar]|eukprot:EIE80151.1 hypothetical protein RO3G_04856 [Rhizopus delemar RA 99-880]
MPSTFTRITRSTSKTAQPATFDTVTPFTLDKPTSSIADKSISFDTTMTASNGSTTEDVTSDTTIDSISDTTMTPSTSTSSLKAKRTRSKEPKLFQCTGYGDCKMVFTRSEHLARHTRKHTGEKPFKCCIPGCKRTFSRFDNMIQHTQTHRGKLPTSNLDPEAEAERQKVFEMYHRQNQEKNQGEIPLQHIQQLHPLQQLQHLQPQQLQQLQQLQQRQQTPPPALLRELWLTQDEFEALQGFGLFQQKPVIIDSFQGLAQAVYIEPNPSRP